MRILGLFTTICALVALIALAACGGSGENSTGTITSVTATCHPDSIRSNETSQCSFTLGCTGDACSTGVNWSATTGTINAAGLFTAPETGPTLKVTITATSVRDPSKSGNATVIVNPLTP